MKKLWYVLVPVALFLAACGQQDPQLQQEAAPELSRLGTDYTEAPENLTQSEYAIVTFKSPPAASYEGGLPGLGRTKPERGSRFDADSPAVRAYLRHLENEHANFRSFLQRGAPRAEIVEAYVTTLNAVAVKLNGTSLRSLQRGPDVRSVDYSALYRPTMDDSVRIVEADTFWTSTGLKGAGIRVGIIDSGIDASHPFFACKTFEEPRVYASGVAFDPTNILVNDHGTHVAGTVAGCELTPGPVGVDLNGDESGNGTLSGVAPEAELRDYNVFPGFGAGWVAFGGSAFSHDIAAAIEDAVLDGMHVINMSLGGTVQGPHDFLAEASNAAVDAGLVVVTSAGNSGPNLYTIGSPGSAENVITVAATTNSHALVLPVDVDFDGDVQRFEGARGDFDPFAANPVSDVPLTLASDHGDELACTALSGSLDGTVVLIQRGACAFSVKVANAAAAGATGAIVYNNAPGEGPIAMAGAGDIPAIGISYDAGTTIVSDYVSGSTTVSIDGNTIVETALDPDLLATFSSRGPTPYTGIIKPDLAAPGVNILSSVFGSDFAMFNGTSMASPHVAGAAALLLGANPDWSPAQVKAALVNGADSLGYAIHQVGNGRLNVANSNDLEFLVSPPSVSFGYHNRGGHAKIEAVDLTVMSLGGPAACTVDGAGSDLSLSSSDFTAAPEATLTVTLNNTTTRSGEAEGYLDVTCDDQSVRVPWASYTNPPGRP